VALKPLVVDYISKCAGLMGLIAKFSRKKKSSCFQPPMYSKGNHHCIAIIPQCLAMCLNEFAPSEFVYFARKKLLQTFFSFPKRTNKRDRRKFYTFRTLNSFI